MTDADETVWVAKACSRSRQKRIYHSDSDCRFIADSHMARTRGNLGDEYRECYECAGDFLPAEKQDQRESLLDLIRAGEVEVGGDA